jgi:glycosyltransferase involved in cell wall biosynthesis
VIKISLVIIALNEEAGIARCIESAKWVDEVIVVDSGSIDQTQEIATTLGARVIVEKWRGYHEQKVFATGLAQNDWILSLDADEALSPDLSHALEQICRDPLSFDFDHCDGIEFSRISFYLGRWIKHGGWFPDWQLRFFNRKRAMWTATNVHERIESRNKIRMTQSILHWPFVDITEQVTTNNRYSGLGADNLFHKNEKFSLLKLIFKPISKFLETYVIKMGFRDGMAGYIISIGAAYSIFLKYAKLWEKQKIQDPLPKIRKK